MRLHLGEEEDIFGSCRSRALLILSVVLSHRWLFHLLGCYLFEVHPRPWVIYWPCFLSDPFLCSCANSEYFAVVWDMRGGVYGFAFGISPFVFYYYSFLNFDVSLTQLSRPAPLPSFFISKRSFCYVLASSPFHVLKTASKRTSRGAFLRSRDDCNDIHT